VTLERTPTLDEVIERAILAVLCERAQTMPAQVLAYDRLTQRAQVQPALKIARGDLDGDGEIDYDALPVLVEVPVLWPRGGGYALHLPLEPGDTVLLVVTARSLEEWLERGGVDVEPQDLRVLALQDAVAIPGLYPAPEALSGNVARASEAVLSTQDAATQLRVAAATITATAQTVLLGGPGATDPVALSGLVAVELGKVALAITTLSTQLIALGQPGAVYTPASVAATQTRAL